MTPNPPSKSAVELELFAQLRVGGMPIAFEADRTSTSLVLSATLGDWTLGGMIRYLVNLAEPDFDFELEPPWNLLNEISLKGLTFKFDLTNNKVGFEYELPSTIDLTFIKITRIGLWYSLGGATRTTGQAGAAAGGASKSVDLSVFGSFLGKSYDSPNPPLSWDLLTQPPPSSTGNGTPIFDLDYLGLGQHVTLTDLAKRDTMVKVVQGLQDAHKPVPPDQNPLKSLEALRFSADAEWLVGAKFSVLNTVALSVVFNDPTLYGLSIGLSGARAGALAGLRFEILYRKIAADLGVYHIDLRLPDSIRQIELGAGSLTLPNIIVDIYTNGNFLVDIGFPHNRDFSNSATFQIIILGVPVLGAGGFYFGLLDSRTAPMVRKPINGEFKPLIVFGFGLQVGFGKTVEKGVLRAGFLIAIEGIVEGALGFFQPSLPSVPKDTYFAVSGTLAIIGHLYGMVDFAVVKAQVDVYLYVSAQIVYERYEPVVITVEAGVVIELKIWVDLGLFSFSIKYSFSATIREQLTLGSKGDAPWQFGAQQSGFGNSIRQPQAFAALRAGARTLGLGTSLRERLADLSGLDAPASRATITLFFQPQVTVGASGAGWQTQLVALLFVRTAGDDSFTGFARELLRWALGQLAQSPGAAGVSTTTYVTDLMPQISYTTVAQFLGERIRLTIQPGTALDQKDVVTIFPMLPFLTLDIGTGAPAIDFTSHNPADAGYRAFLSAYFAQLSAEAAASQVVEDLSPVLLLAEETPTSLVATILIDYVELVLRFLLQEVIDLDESAPEKLSSFDTLTGTLNDEGAFEKAAGAAARFLMHGLRLPDPAALRQLDTFGALGDGRIDLAGIDVAPLYVQTGQQWQLSTPLPNDSEVTLAARSGAPDWLALPNAVMVDSGKLASIGAIAGLSAKAPPFDPGIRSVAELAPYSVVPKCYALGTAVPWSTPVVPSFGGTTHPAGTPVQIYPFSGGLRAQIAAGASNHAAPPPRVAQGALTAGGGAPASTAPLTEFGWATRLNITLRQVADLDHPGQFVPAIYEVYSGDQDARQDLLGLVTYLEGDGASDLVTLDLLYAADPATGQGLISDAMGPAAIVLLQANLSTLTHSPRPRLVLLGLDDTQPPPPPVYDANLNDARNFLILLWKGSVVNTGGFYLSYRTPDGNGLPDRLFDRGATATLTVLAMVRPPHATATAATIDPRSFHNSIVCPSLATNTMLFVDPPLATVQTVVGGGLVQSETLSHVAARLGVTVAELMQANATVAHLLRPGAGLVAPGTLQYTIVAGDTLLSIAATTRRPLAHVIVAAESAPVLKTGVQIQAGASIYTIAAGDTLSSIAQNLKLSAADLGEANSAVAMFDPHATNPTLAVQIAHSVQVGDTLLDIALALGIALADLARLAADADILAAGAQLYAAPAWMVRRAALAAGRAGFRLVRDDPYPRANDPNPVAPADIRLRLAALYNLLGFRLEESDGFRASAEGLPVGPADDRPEAINQPPDTPAIAPPWVYRRALAVAQMAKHTDTLAQIAARPLPDQDPYAGTGGTARIAMQYHDVFGNRALPGTAMPMLPITVRYRDALAGLSQWGGVATTYDVAQDGDQAQLLLRAAFDPAQPLPAPGADAAQSAAHALAARDRYRQVYFQITQADVTLAATTTLDSQQPHALEKQPFVNLVLAAYQYLSAVAALLPVKVAASQTAQLNTLAQIAAAYHVAVAALAEANQNAGILAVGTLTAPIFETVVRNDSLSAIAARQTSLGNAVADSQLAVRNQAVPLRAGAALAFDPSLPAYLVKEGDTLVMIAAARRVTVEQLAGQAVGDKTIAALPNLFPEGAQLRVGDRTVTVAAGDTLAAIARANNVTVAELAEANHDSTTLLAAGLQLVVPGHFTIGDTAVTAEGDTLLSAAARHGVSLAALAAANPKLALASQLRPGDPPVTMRYPGAASVTLQPGDTLDNVLARFQTQNGAITADTLLAANRAAPDLLGPGTTLTIPHPAVSAIRADRTLGGAAKSLGVPVAALAAANQLIDGLLDTSAALAKPTGLAVRAGDTLATLLAAAQAQPGGASLTLAQLAEANANVALLADGARLLVPPAEVAATIAITPSFPDLIFPLAVAIAISRSDALVDPELADAPGVAQISADVRPDLRPRAERIGDPPPDDAAGLRQFAQRFEQAFAQLKLGSGAYSGGVGAASSNLLAVQFKNDKLNYTIGSTPHFFAVRPLATNRWSSDSVPIWAYKRGATWADLTAMSNTRTAMFHDIDLDTWGRDFLGAIDRVLSAEYAVPAQRLDRDAYTRIVGAKETLASAIRNAVEPIVAGDTGDLDAAKMLLYEYVRISLGMAYSIDTIIQLPTAVTSPDTDRKTARRLSGQMAPLPYSIPAGATLETVAHDFAAPTTLLAAMIADDPAILDRPGAKLNLIRREYTIAAGDTLGGALNYMAPRMANGQQMDAAIANLAAMSGDTIDLFGAGVTLTVDTYRVTAGATFNTIAQQLGTTSAALGQDNGLIDQLLEPGATITLADGRAYDVLPDDSLHSIAETLGVPLADLVAAIADLAGVLATGAALRITARSHTIQAGDTLAAIAQSLELPPEQVVASQLEAPNVLRVGATLAYLARVPGFSLSEAKLPLVGAASDATFLFQTASDEQTSNIAAQIGYQINEMEYNIADVTDRVPTAASYQSSDWLTFILPITESLGVLDIPIPLRAYPVPPAIERQAIVQDVPDQPTLRDLRTYRYEFTYSYHPADQDHRAAGVNYNVVSTDIGAEGANASADTLARALAQYASVAAALNVDLAALTSLKPSGNDAGVEQAATSAVQAFSYLAQSIAAAWHATTLDNTVPTVFDTENDGAGDGPDRRTATFENLDVLIEQNAWGGIWVRRNELLLAHHATSPSFIYQTPTIRSATRAAPLLTYRNPFDIASVPTGARQQRTLFDHLVSLFDGLLTPPAGRSQPYGCSVRVAVSFGFFLTTATPMQHNAAATALTNITTLMPVLVSPNEPFDRAVDLASSGLCGRLATAMTSWFQQNAPAQDGGLWSLDVSVYTTVGSGANGKAASAQLPPLLELTNLRLAIADIISA